MQTKMFQWVIAAALMCGTSVFTSCTSKNDNPVAPAQPDLNIAEKIIGRWMDSLR